MGLLFVTQMDNPKQFTMLCLELPSLFHQLAYWRWLSEKDKGVKRKQIEHMGKVSTQ